MSNMPSYTGRTERKQNALLALFGRDYIVVQDEHSVLRCVSSWEHAERIFHWQDWVTVRAWSEQDAIAHYHMALGQWQEAESDRARGYA